MRGTGLTNRCESRITSLLLPTPLRARSLSLFVVDTQLHTPLKFNDTEVECVYEPNFRTVQGSDGEDQRQICGLFAALDWFRLIEGDLSPRVREARDLLLWPDMRRCWYRRFGNDMNPAAMQLRERSVISQERFG